MKIFRSTFVLPAALAVLAIGLASCDSTAPIDSVQDVADVQFSASGGLVGFLEKTTESSVDYNVTQTFDLYHFNDDGSMGNMIGAPSQSNVSYFPAIFNSSDNRFGLVQLGSNIYRIEYASSSLTQVVSNAMLIGASPDLRYVVSSLSDAGTPTKLFAIYDISAQPARQVTRFNAIGATSDRVQWLENGQFAVTHSDSILYHVNIYDTTGVMLRSISNAEVTLHASAFAPLSHQLFFRDDNSYLQVMDLTSGARSVVVPDAPIESMDATNDGKLVVYIAEDSLQTRSMYALNTANGHTTKLAQDAISLKISPTADRVAYIHLVDPSNTDVHVTGVTLPQ